MVRQRDIRVPDSHTATGYTSAFPRRDAPEVCFSFTPSEIKRGRRESRMRAAPAVACAKRTSRPQAHRSIRLSLRDPLLLIRDLPGDRASATVACGLTMHPARLAVASPHDLTPAWASDHTFRRARLSRQSSRGPLGYPTSFAIAVSSACPSRRRCSRSSSALQSLSRPTLSRPSHPTSRSCVRTPRWVRRANYKRDLPFVLSEIFSTRGA